MLSSTRVTGWMSLHHLPVCQCSTTPHLHRRTPTRFDRKLGLRHASQSGRVRAAASVSAAPKPAIDLSEKALKHLQKLRSQSGSDKLLLRIGVKSGGCSGMSYLMDFEQETNVKPDDSIIDYENQFKLVCDSKSLLYLFGMQLDYSDALIGGGFQFHNPNAQDTCGCGKSFGV